MSGLMRDDLIELGVSVPTTFLTEWASDQIEATKGKETRLATRGVAAADLTEVRTLLDTVEKRHAELEELEDLVPRTAELAEEVRAEALGWWREAKRLAHAAYSAQPDQLAQFRTGVQTGLLLMNLVRELQLMGAKLREHAGKLGPLGATADFLARGDAMIDRLKDVKAKLDASCRAFPATTLQQCHDKGLLYDRTRRLVRVGRLEFRPGPEEASSFNFTLVRRDRKPRPSRGR